MAGYLFTVSIGPVQEFIRSARRTRDLWAGSHLLSEVSRCVADKLKEHGKLIFPGSLPGDKTRQVSNVLLADINLTVEPDKFAAALKVAANKRLANAGDEALKNAPNFAEEALFREQLEDLLEFYSAWVPFDGSGYPLKRGQVARLLAARKNCREFKQSLFAQMQVPKSSLDGNRETVIREGVRLAPGVLPRVQLHRDLRLNPGEELDAIGLTKRMADNKKYYPSISRIAAEPWICGMKDDELTALGNECVTVSQPADWPQFRRFPYEGSVLYQQRHHELESYFEPEQLAQKQAALAAVKKLLKKWDDPQTYVAILQADGDKMGRLISSLQTAGEHQEFSRKLAEFAAGVKKIVESHQGCLIFAGADDVLALLPLHTCLQAAKEIQASFETKLENQATLSVGLGIGHFMDPMEDLLEYARTAEKTAKDEGRNRLCVTLQPRSGSPLSYTQAWPENPDEVLLRYTEWHRQDAISDKAAYDLNRLLTLYDPPWPDAAAGMEAFREDARRILARKSRINPHQDAAIAEIDAALGTLQSLTDAKRMCAGLLIARRLKTAFEQAWPGTKA